jgi:ribosomal-protein-serine acetyltransferase
MGWRTGGSLAHDRGVRPRDLLEQDGVTLRRWRSDDADTVFAIVSESLEHLAPWMAWAAGGYSYADAVSFVQQCQLDWDDGTSYNYAIIAPDGAVVGSCGLMARIGPGGLEIGYWLHPRYTGQGIAVRAAAALTTEAFRIGADRVEIVHDVANVRSGAVPRRLAFEEVARRPPQEPLTSAEQGEDVVWRKLRGDAS